MSESVGQDIKGQATIGGYLSGSERKLLELIVEHSTGFHIGAPT